MSLNLIPVVLFVIILCLAIDFINLSYPTPEFLVYNGIDLN